MVPQTIKDGNIDTLVMEAGSIEITNIDVNKAMMNTDKDIEESKKEWFELVEESSKSLFKIAEDCVIRNPNMNVVIVKRPDRFDRGTKDILGIKPKLSEYANKVYDQCLLQSNHAGKIHVIDIKLGAKNSNYLKDIIFGMPDNPRYDGIHLSGSEARRHFSYRVVQALKHIVTNRRRAKMFPSSTSQDSRGVTAGLSDSSYHMDCPQARYQRDQFRKNCGNRASNQRHYVSYADAVKNNEHTTRVGQKYIFSIPTTNRFDQLPRKSQGNW